MSKYLILQEDASKFHIKYKTVNLVITEFPGLLHDISLYGGDKKRQISYGGFKKYIKKIVKMMQRIELSLVNDGNIFIILENDFFSHYVIDSIIKNTTLTYAHSFEISPPQTLQDFFDFYQYPRRTVYRFTKSDSAYINKYLPTLLMKDSPLVFEKDNFVNDADLARYGYILGSLPIELVDMLIKVFSAEGDLVYNPLAGTGTVTLAAVKNNRRVISIDVSEDRIKIIKERMRLMVGYGKPI